jgi:hypothetical protein
MDDLRRAIVQAEGLYTRAGLARRWGVSRTIVGKWTRSPDFPEPAAWVDARYEVWSALEADAWRQHRPE